VKDGLGDREATVRVAAGKVIGSWFDVIVLDGGKDGTIMGGILGFLRIFDIIGPGEGVAADALLSIFVTRKDVVDEIVFDGMLCIASLFGKKYLTTFGMQTHSGMS
jgi:condensin complex subunit 3